ncbi:MAG TPA: LLM class flavin-dependent oxidoreductase [Mycobacteriales bacterium]|nr:LLM class flavin-dependent oxidoreductase [Mycobacteriales bacterium]
MRFGVSLPIFDRLADPVVLAELAAVAEQAGWDGVFVWDHLQYRPPITSATDPWIALAAMAARTERVLLGPMVTPLARRRPQVVARQLVALDQLARGRVIFGAGLGLDASGEEFSRFGEPTNVRLRAEMFDEALTVLGALLTGEPVNHEGRHYAASNVQFRPPPYRDRIPIWIAARWPNRAPMRRAARFDGVNVIDLGVEHLPAVLATIGAERPEGTAGFDVVVGAGPGADPRPWADAGATWLLTGFDAFTVTVAGVEAVLRNGPRR